MHYFNIKDLYGEIQWSTPVPLTPDIRTSHSLQYKIQGGHVRHVAMQVFMNHELRKCRINRSAAIGVCIFV